MKVEILYLAGCPNFGSTVQLVQDTLRQESVLAEIHETEVHTAEEARATGFLGSPSVRVNGVDVEPEARTARSFGLGCRTYLDGERRSGTPPAELIRRAVRKQVSG